MPRYNEFRELFHLKPVELVRGSDRQPEGGRRSFASLRRASTGSTSWSASTRSRCPKGFGFSDTAFRVFVLMASRRLKSDRFFTTDYTPAVYTQAGLDWIDDDDDDDRAPPALPGARAGAAQRRQRLRALAEHTRLTDVHPSGFQPVNAWDKVKELLSGFTDEKGNIDWEGALAKAQEMGLDAEKIKSLVT